MVVPTAKVRFVRCVGIFDGVRLYPVYLSGFGEEYLFKKREGAFVGRKTRVEQQGGN